MKPVHSIAFLTLYLFSCGCVRSAPIVSGKSTLDVAQPTNINKAPYLASIRLKSFERLGGYGYGHLCGGAVISQRLVITAAQCVLNTAKVPLTFREPDELTLVMGSSFLKEKNAYVLQYDVEKVLPYPNFNATSLANDVALLVIKGYIPRQWPTVRAISLQTTALDPNTNCHVSGWGKMTPQQSDMSDVMLTANIPTISNAECSKNYGYIPPGMLCAGYAQGGLDACEGNSGGPLVCSGRLSGIVSWGISCGRAGYPGVYTNVSSYNFWIQYVITSLNHNGYGGGAISSFKASKHLLVWTLLVSFALGLILRI